MTCDDIFDDRCTAAGRTGGDDLATGASIVVAVAAAIALVLALLVASLSASTGARAATLTGPQPIRHLVVATVSPDGLHLVGAEIVAATPATYRIEAVLPARDGTFTVADPFEAGGASLAGGVLALLGLALATATLSAGRAFLGRLRGGAFLGRLRGGAGRTAVRT